MWFHRRRFFKKIEISANQEQELPMAMFVSRIGQNENLYIGPPIDASCIVLFNFFKYSQLERIADGSHVCCPIETK